MSDHTKTEPGHEAHTTPIPEIHEPTLNARGPEKEANHIPKDEKPIELSKSPKEAVFVYSVPHSAPLAIPLPATGTFPTPSPPQHIARSHEASPAAEGARHPTPATIAGSPSRSFHDGLHQPDHKHHRSKSKVKQPIDLNTISFPPTEQDLFNYVDTPSSKLPKLYKRNDRERVFCNRSVSLQHIKSFGFDMDYTLAVYNSPSIDILAYDLAVERLVALGYPSEIANFKFDPDFPIRGLFFDKLYGTLMKLDSFGNILIAFHGRTRMTVLEIEKIYPSKFVSNLDMSDGGRFYVMNTMFNIPESCLVSDLINFFEQHPAYRKLENDTGIRSSDSILLYSNIFTDVRESIDYVHNQGKMKERTVQNLPLYIKKDARLPLLLQRMKDNGATVFLATNSDYHYTQAVMTYLFDVPHPQGGATRDWKTYFDLIVVSAKKPLFFEEGSIMREVNQETGSLKLGQYDLSSCEDIRGRVFSGGSSALFSNLLGWQAGEVLYVGDHIFGDILKSKKHRGWRTLLVIPELDKEIEITARIGPKYDHLKNLEFLLNEQYKGLNSESTKIPNADAIMQAIQDTTDDLDFSYNKYFGSLFRCGARQSFFSMQMRRFADLYSTTCANLWNYPLFYQYFAMDQPLPHEPRIVTE